MQIHIVNCPGENLFHWKLYDGPDGIDFRMGYARDLNGCFHAIEIARAAISRDYIEATPQELNGNR